MTIDPARLRAIAPGQILTIDHSTAPMIADALEIADSCARADIESHCTARGEGEDYRGWWWDTSSAAPEDEDTVAQALRYCEARELLDRHSDDAALVRFKERATA